MLYLGTYIVKDVVKFFFDQGPVLIRTATLAVFLRQVDNERFSIGPL